MKKIFLILLILASGFSTPWASADPITDPVQAFLKLGKLSPGRVIYKWEIDLNRDGKKEILLCVKPTPEEENQEERETNWNPQTPYLRGFIVYVLKSNADDKKYYSQVQINGLTIDIRYSFVGKVTQLGQWGVVTSFQVPQGTKNEEILYNIVCAYTLEGDQLKATHLVKYDPKKGSNAIYDQYFSDSHRTTLKIEEITVR